MPPLNPNLDFEDDGGTPHWRARHARVIDVSPPHGRLLARLGRVPFWKLAAAAFFGAMLLPWAVMLAWVAVEVVWWKMTTPT